jgi:uncharacterized membrane protein (DUF4010 family)
MDLYINLGLSLALGLLIGAERGWQMRQSAEGTRIAGIRTFGLIGLLGGLWGLLAQELGEILLGFAFLVLAALLIIAHVMSTRSKPDYGITTVIAALITFVLGALAVRNHPSVAAAGAVVTATLLSLKPVLHRWLQRLEAKELYATLKLLLISVVVLPVLPNQGYGPWQALNPYEIWWLVVLIAAISFVGYFAMKIAGTRIGIMLTGIFGGMVSSTAVTLNFSRLGQQKPLQHILAAGILAAGATMFPRILLEVAVVNPNLLFGLAVPLTTMTFVTYTIAALLWRKRTNETSSGQLPLSNPFQLGPALKFGALLVLVMLLAKAFNVWFGEAGIYILSAISGISDVDAITLSLAGMARNGLGNEIAVRSIILAAMVNTLVKSLMVVFIAGGKMAIYVGSATVLILAIGAVSLFL